MVELMLFFIFCDAQDPNVYVHIKFLADSFLDNCRIQSQLCHIVVCRLLYIIILMFQIYNWNILYIYMQYPAMLHNK